ncbi:MAG: hypothetical protein GF408_01725 [Candidatus Omnitrophica bacterium]|nr:hypothetical protein [Candidatus Omnitrophota bacterium]
MPYRKDALGNNEIYHVYSRSIAQFQIFNSSNDFKRMILSLHFFKHTDPGIKFWQYYESLKFHKINTYNHDMFNGKEPLVDLIAFCMMPTHIHLILRQVTDKGISRYMYMLLKSYTQYFNFRHSRKGPLWESRFRNVHVKTDEQFLHLTRYIHLNPCTSELVKNPEDWNYSSYKEYTSPRSSENNGICEFNGLLDMCPKKYRTFTNDRKDYQRKLHLIKHLCLE